MSNSSLHLVADKRFDDLDVRNLSREFVEFSQVALILCVDVPQGANLKAVNILQVRIHDSHFVLSLHWPTLFILLFCEELRGGTRILLLVLSIPLVLSYESALFFGLILAGVCVWRMNKYSRRRALAGGLAIWYLCCAGVAATSILIPFDPTNKNGFVNGLIGVLHSGYLGAKASVPVVLSCPLLLLTSVRYSGIQNLLAAVGIAAVSYEVFRVLVAEAPETLDSQLGARSLNLLVPLAATGLLYLCSWACSSPTGVRCN